MKKYILRSSDKKKTTLAMSYLALCAQGGPGEVLIREGFSKRAFCEFAAELITLAVANGQGKEQIAKLIGDLALQNQSQARQIVEVFEINIDDQSDPKKIDEEGKPLRIWRSVSTFWGTSERRQAPADILAKLGL